MAADWDPSRDYDSGTFTEDFNLHGASGRSLDHDSVTHDDDFFKALRRGSNDDGDDHGTHRRHHHNNYNNYDDDDDSIDNADLDLYADIVDDRIPLHPNNRYQRAAPARGAVHQTDDNSASSIMRYLREGSPDDGQGDGYQESPDFMPARFLGDQQPPIADDGNDDHFREWSGSTPKRSIQNVQEQRASSKASPMTKRTMLPTRQSVENLAKQVWRVRGVSIDENYKPPAPKSGIPTRSGHGTAIPSPRRLLGEKTIDRNSNTNIASKVPPPRPIFRSALKPTSYTSNNNSSNANGNNNGQAPPRSKLGRHIQLPTETLDDEDEEESEQDLAIDGSPEDEFNNDKDKGKGRDTISQQEAAQVEQTENTAPTGRTEDADDQPEDAIGAIIAVPATPPAPGPTRFTRITKKTESPAKKSTTIIPTPQDDGSEQLQKEVKEMKAVLARLGLPLSSALGSAFEGMDTLTPEKGGLRETMRLLFALGVKCEGQQKVIHEMSNQIMESDESRKLAEELNEVKSSLDLAQERNRELAAQSSELANELEQLRSTKEANTDISTAQKKPKFLDAATEISGTWGGIEEFLDQVGERSKSGSSKKNTQPQRQQQQQQTEGSPEWRRHIQKIEQEVKALKTLLDRQTLGGSGATSEEVEELEERLEKALQENRQLNQTIKSVTRELRILREDEPGREERERSLRYKSLLKEVMERIGVESHKQIMPALKEIERIVKDLRRFVAKAERIIWESEIVEGTVKVQKFSRGRPEEEEEGIDGAGVGGVSNGPTIKTGRTCSQSHEETLQRLKEWSELLDVFNHIKFADDDDEDASIVPPS